MNLKKLRALDWKPWIQRPFTPFITSLFVEANSERYCEKIGMKGTYFIAEIYQYGYWYKSQKVWDDQEKKFTLWHKNHSMFEVTASLDKFYKEKKKRILSLVNEKGDPIAQLEELYDILTTVGAYIMVAHGLEEYYAQQLKKEVPKYVKGDIDKFVGDASFPKKKNVHVLLDEALLRKDDPKKIVERFGWVRVRDGFSDPFTVADVKKMIKNAKKTPAHKSVKIPKELTKIFKEMRELVYFRTARTDVFYEFLFIARPILKKVAKHYQIPFSELKHYTVQSLIEGKPEKYNLDFSFVSFEGNFLYSNKKIIKDEIIQEQDSVKGTIAQLGKVTGTAKIVTNVSELDKVKQGDILITQMTFPSFIVAMQRAAAFVTDEGGITCHAAIVAREMKKPCIIGTKIATKIFKDGDKIEVDANKGTVTILSRRS